MDLKESSEVFKLGTWWENEQENQAKKDRQLALYLESWQKETGKLIERHWTCTLSPHDSDEYIPIPSTDTVFYKDATKTHFGMVESTTKSSLLDLDELNLIDQLKGIYPPKNIFRLLRRVTIHQWTTIVDIDWKCGKLPFAIEDVKQCIDIDVPRHNPILVKRILEGESEYYRVVWIPIQHRNCVYMRLDEDEDQGETIYTDPLQRIRLALSNDCRIAQMTKVELRQFITSLKRLVE